MDGTSAYLDGLKKLVPLFLVQLLLARLLLRRWPKLKWYVAVFAAVLCLGGLTANFPRVRHQLPRWLYMLTFIYLFTSMVGYAGFVVTEWLLRRFEDPCNPDPKRRELIQNLALAAAVGPVAVSLYGTFIERTAFRVTETEIPLQNLPPDLQGMRILQISDVHRSSFLSQKDLIRAIDAAREIKFDLVIHNGDFITTSGDPLEACIAELGRLQGPEGTLGCLGNHEIYAECEDYAAELAGRSGIHILRSQSQIIQRGTARLNIAGVDYQQYSKRHRYLRGAESLIVPGAVNVLLSHNPDVFPTAAGLGFDLTLAGHTHGGQVRVEILHTDINPGRFHTPYVAGLYQYDGRRCYVTRGIGSISLPMRLGAPPEISLLRLSRA